MRLTEALKQWLSKNYNMDPNALDDVVRAAVAKALSDGTLTVKQFDDLTKDAVSEEANVFNQKLDRIAESLGKLAESMTVKEVKLTEEKTVEPPTGEKKVSDLGKTIAEIGQSAEKTGETRVKSAAEQYDSTKSLMTYPSQTKSGKAHPFAGRPVQDYSDGGHTIDNASQLDKAVIGVYCKLLCAAAQRGGSKTFAYQSLPEHDKSLLHHALEKMEWSGASDGGDHADIKRRRLNPHEQKALIDDSTSGGLEAAPIVFDDMVISTPLLYGELYPLVTTVPIPRGRRIEGVAVGQVTGGWGGIDDTAVSLFSTASYVSAFNTTIFRWEGAIRIGLDFLSDTPIDFGSIVSAQYGEQLLNDLDDVIATGNGTTQPEGITVKSGTTSVAWGGATSIGNYESLLFAIPKAEHRPNVMSSAVFCGNETSYARARAIPIGASDARRLFGSGTFGTSGYKDYTLMDRPYKINSTMANTQVFYAILAKYRMYRREGLTMRQSTEGDTLIRNNEMLMVAMARYGGQLERGACAAYTSTAPA